MAMKTRENFFGVTTNINTTRLYPTSRLVSQITGMPIPRNKAIIGENAFAHESGIHQHGMLKNSSTYEIMRPQDVGLSRTNLVLGKHSGRHAFRERVKELGFEVDDAELNRLFEEFKALADKKKELFDGDIEALVMRAENGCRWSVGRCVSLQIETDSAGTANVMLPLAHTDGREVEQRMTAEGPVDAVVKAIDAATGTHVQLRKFEVHSVSVGEDAQGEALLTVEHNGRSYRGAGVSTNIIEAAARSYLEVINRIEATRAQRRTLRSRAPRRRPLDDLSHLSRRRRAVQERMSCPSMPQNTFGTTASSCLGKKRTVHVLAHALHYGSTVFEGERAYATPQGPIIFRLRDHTRRLFDSAKIYRMDIPYTPEQINAACKEVIVANGLKRAPICGLSRFVVTARSALHRRIRRRSTRSLQRSNGARISVPKASKTASMCASRPGNVSHRIRFRRWARRRAIICRAS